MTPSNKIMSDVMHAGIETVEPGRNILDTVNILKEKRIGAIAVVENNNLVGMFSERDLITKVVSAEVNTREVTMGEVMTSPVITIHEGANLHEAYVLMNDNGIRHLPVVNDQGLPVGIVSQRDLMQGIMQEVIENFMNAEAA